MRMCTTKIKKTLMAASVAVMTAFAAGMPVMAAEAGATYVSPFLGRLDEAGATADSNAAGGFFLLAGGLLIIIFAVAASVVTSVVSTIAAVVDDADSDE